MNRVSIRSFLASLLALALAVAPAPAQTAELVSSWRAEGDASDVTGKNPGVENDAVAYVPGAAGQAFSLLDSGYISVTNPTFNEQEAAFSVAAWIRISAYRDAAPVVNFRNSSNTSGFTLEQYYGNPGTMQVAINQTGTSQDFSIITAPGWQLDTLYHVAATFESATGTLALYRDGDLVASRSDLPHIPMAAVANPAFQIGRNIVIHSLWNGTIDEVCYYDGALTREEVAARAARPPAACGTGTHEQEADVVLLPVAPTPSGGGELIWVQGTAINNTGVIVGYQHWHPFEGPVALRWSLQFGTVEVLGGPLDGWIARAMGVNDEGHVAGNLECCEQSLRNGWLLRDQTLRKAAKYTDRKCWTVGVNARDRMAVNFLERGYLWRAPHHFKEVKLPAGAPSSSTTEAAAINDAGHIVGHSCQLPPGPPPYFPVDVAFFWDGSGRADSLELLRGSESRARAINEADDVAGEAEVEPDDDTLHAVLWRGGRIIDLGTLGGRNSTAADLDDHGNVVGSSEIYLGSDTRHAFLWREGEMLDLNDLVPPTWPLALENARAMNDQGQIVCHLHLSGIERPALVTLWARDVTGRVRITVFPVKKDGFKRTQAVLVENLGSSPIEGPVSLVLDELTGATLLTKSGVTSVRAPAASPYVTRSEDLVAGQRMRFTLQYGKSAAGGVSFTPRVLAGVGRR